MVSADRCECIRNGRVDLRGGGTAGGGLEAERRRWPGIGGARDVLVEFLRLVPVVAAAAAAAVVAAIEEEEEEGGGGVPVGLGPDSGI